MMAHSAAVAAHRARVLSLLVALNVLGGCASAPVGPAASTEAASSDATPVAPVATAVKTATRGEPEPHTGPRPELPAAGLRAAQEAFDRGDHVAAMHEWESVAVNAASARDRAHALLGMLTLRVLPSSTLVDPRAAEALMAGFEQHVRENSLHDEFGLDIALLRTLLVHGRELATLRNSNRALRADLAARDALIRKLRALSVGGN